MYFVCYLSERDLAIDIVVVNLNPGHYSIDNIEDIKKFFMCSKS